ncbi:MAG: EF-hand domain-containing protein [Rudaea sp.]
MHTLSARAVAIALMLFACASSFDLHAQQTATPDRTQKAGEKLREKFSAADIDHDGSLTRDEAAKGMPHAAKHFDDIDANHDGKLSLQEIAQYLSAKRRARAS